MAENEVVTPAAPVVTPESAAPVTPAPVPEKAAPAEAAVSGEKPADKIAEFVKKGTLLGDDGAEKPVEEKKDGVVTDPAAAKVVPEVYDIKLKDGMAVDSALLDAVTPVFKKHGITQEVAQEFADAYAPVIKAQAQKTHDAAMKSFDDQVETWGKETKAMLGADPAKAMAPASRFITAFAGKDAPAFRQLLNDTGMGNHPLMVKVLIAAGKAISQDSFVDGGNSAAQDTQEAAVGRLYPTMKK